MGKKTGKSNAGTSKHRKRYDKKGGSKGPITPKWNQPMYGNKYTRIPKPEKPIPKPPRQYNRMDYFLGMIELSEIKLELTGKPVDSELEEKIKETMTNPSIRENNFTVAFKKPSQKEINLSTYLNKQVINSIIENYDGTMTLNIRFIGYTKYSILLQNQNNAENEEIIDEEALKEIINPV